MATPLPLVFAAVFAWITFTAHADDYDLEGSAYIGEAPTPEILARARNQIVAAEAYAACLTKQSGSWFARADLTVCDSARDAYAAFLAAEIADDAVGCLEESAIKSSRVAGRTCAALERRFPVIISWEVTAEDRQ